MAETSEKPTTHLLAALSELDQALAAVRARRAVVGAVAAIVHGRPRATTDIDVIPVFRDKEHLAEFIQEAERAGFKSRDTAESGWTRKFVKLEHRSGLKADIWLTAQEPGLGVEVVRRARPMTVEGRRLRIATPEDVILMKAVAWRPRDVEDIKGVCLRKGPRLDRGYLLRWARRFGVEDRVKKACGPTARRRR